MYRRTERPLPVTENWNAALELSSGEYVLMLGDDDGLLPGYIARMRGLIERFEQPELIHTGALLFTYPGVDPAAGGIPRRTTPTPSSSARPRSRSSSSTSGRSRRSAR